MGVVMRSLIISLFILLGLFFPTLAAALDLTRYIPLAAGTQWIYKNNNNVTQTQTVGSPVVIGGISAFPWASADSDSAGNTVTYSTVDGSGFRWHQENLNNVFVPGKGNTTGTSTYSPAMVIAPADVTVGSTYTSTGTMPAKYTLTTQNMVATVSSAFSYSATTQILGFETVTNYDGTQCWSALKVLSTMAYDNNGDNIHKSMAVTSWLVDGIGAVQTYKPNLSGVMETWKLTSTNVTQGAAPTGCTTLNLSASWNLLGNGTNAPLAVATTFGDATKIATVWKWQPATNKWAFYSPSLDASGALAGYVTGKGYDLLTTVNGGEGFWVNAKQAGNVNLPGGTTSGAALIKGWNLVSTSSMASPRQFCDAQNGGVTTLWAWDSALSNWYFYSTNLDNSGGLTGYIAAKGYLNFGAKTLDPSMGFWVNKP